MNLIDPKEIDINGKKFIISKFPAWEGREIMLMYPASVIMSVFNIPILSDYSKNKEAAAKLLSYVAVEINGNYIKLSTPELINNHAPSWGTLVKLEKEMLTYNGDFFLEEGTLTSLESLSQSAPQWLSKILTVFSERLSPKEKQPSEN